ncbi:glycosyltransferase family 4 protein [Gracilibacillus xinjiangensis]|uniref:Glycosyltransferase family 4 protein n=1 Tax=Gracilibacillus xinjiangensis TaxID=1193282 RepID=A0ABV8WV83_9BACI
MKKNIWIWNHYATNMYKDQAGRHYWFAENLVKQGYKTTIFCASTVHNSSEAIDTGSKLYTSDDINGIPFVFVKTPKYIGNGKQRIINMFSFYKNISSVSKEYAEQYGKPDVILASSVHPLTLVAGIKMAKKLNIPCISEVRDLWPETIVEYGSLKRNSIVSNLLYLGEKWIYKRADKLIFTMEGGKDYIIEKGWDKENGGPIDISKIHHINNGVDLKSFHYNRKNHVFDDSDLNNLKQFKVIYTGSIRKANNIMKIVKAAEYIERTGRKDIKFLIFGDGPEKERLEQYCSNKNIQNIKFKGFVNKNKIPYILSKSNLNIMHFEQNNIKKYGASLNKMFEYFASGKPTISDCEFGYDLIKKYNCGVVIDNANEKQLAESIMKVSELPKEDYLKYCNNALKASHEFDFKKLTSKLENIL